MTPLRCHDAQGRSPPERRYFVPVKRQNSTHRPPLASNSRTICRLALQRERHRRERSSITHDGTIVDPICASMFAHGAANTLAFRLIGVASVEQSFVKFNVRHRPGYYGPTLTRLVTVAPNVSACAA